MVGHPQQHAELGTTAEKSWQARDAIPCFSTLQAAKTCMLHRRAPDEGVCAALGPRLKVRDAIPNHHHRLEAVSLQTRAEQEGKDAVH